MLVSVTAKGSHSPAFPAWLASDLAPDPTAGWPLLAAPVPADFPSQADDSVERYLSLDEHLIRQPESTFLVRASGDSLAGAGIHDGDLLVMDRAVPATENSVVLAMVEGAFLLACVGCDAHGQRVLCATAPDSGNRRLDEVVTVGVARWTIHRLWPGRLAS